MCRKPVTDRLPALQNAPAAATVRFPAAATVKGHAGSCRPIGGAGHVIAVTRTDADDCRPDLLFLHTLGPWRKQTGVYLPPGTDTDKGFIDMLLYLHGHLVPSIEQLFNLDGVQVRQQVLASGKKIALVAPWLGRGRRPQLQDVGPHRKLW